MSSNLLAVLDKAYADRQLCTDNKVSKETFIVGDVLEIVTYDEELDKLFFNDIFEVLEIVYCRTTAEYISESLENYKKFITVLNLGHVINMVDWGINVQNCWMNTSTRFIILGDVVITDANMLYETLAWWYSLDKRYDPM